MKCYTCDSACVKYLSHFICSDLTDDTDILRQRRCLSIQGNVLLRKFHMCSIGVRLARVMSFCYPMYTSQLWWNYKKCNMKRLLITYHNVFKMSISMSKCESNSLLCTVYNVLCCQAVIGNLVYRFICRLQASNNSLVMYIQSSSLVCTSRYNPEAPETSIVCEWVFFIIILFLYLGHSTRIVSN